MFQQTIKEKDAPIWQLHPEQSVRCTCVPRQMLVSVQPAWSLRPLTLTDKPTLPLKETTSRCFFRQENLSVTLGFLPSCQSKTSLKLNWKHLTGWFFSPYLWATENAVQSTILPEAMSPNYSRARFLNFSLFSPGRILEQNIRTSPRRRSFRM